MCVQDGGGCMVVCMDRFELMDHSVIWLWCTATLEAKTKTHGKAFFLPKVGTYIVFLFHTLSG